MMTLLIVNDSSVDLLCRKGICLINVILKANCVYLS